MDLDSWIAEQGKGERERLHRVAAVSLPAIDRARKRRATLAVAEKLHLATGGKVELGHMTTDRPLPEGTPKRRGGGKRATA